MSLRARRRHHRLLQATDLDPLSGMANLFDAGMVFAAAMMVLLLLQNSATEESGASPTDLAPDSKPLERFRPTRRDVEGNGERLGTAYRLTTGEVVYVPDAPVVEPPRGPGGPP